MKVIIDHFEREFVIVELEDKTMADMHKKLVPSEAKEGDVLEIKVDANETEMRKKRIQELAEDIFN